MVALVADICIFFSSTLEVFIRLDGSAGDSVSVKVCCPALLPFLTFVMFFCYAGFVDDVCEVHSVLLPVKVVCFA